MGGGRPLSPAQHSPGQNPVLVPNSTIQAPWAGVSKGLPKSPQIIVHRGARVCVGKEAWLRIHLLAHRTDPPCLKRDPHCQPPSAPGTGGGCSPGQGILGDPPARRQQIFPPPLSAPGQAGGSGSPGPSGPDSGSLSLGRRVRWARYSAWTGTRERPRWMLREDPGPEWGPVMPWKTLEELGVLVLGPNSTGLWELLAKCRVHGRDPGTACPAPAGWARSPDTSSTQGAWPEAVALPELSVTR